MIASGDGIHLELPSETERLMTPASWQGFFSAQTKPSLAIQAFVS
jgi:hypothetical protein